LLEPALVGELFAAEYTVAEIRFGTDDRPTIPHLPEYQVFPQCAAQPFDQDIPLYLCHCPPLLHFVYMLAISYLYPAYIINPLTVLLSFWKPNRPITKSLNHH
jgi:hypothetical protein